MKSRKPTPKYEEQKIDITPEDVENALLGEKREKIIDLDETAKAKKKTYDIDDTVIRDISLTGDIHVRLISNVNGYFVDIRKYYKQYPTKKGIRILASKFNIAADYLKNDLLGLINK
ncbi:hypothetical protein [Clostridium sp.]|uniref:hypothetical protein n=1 Tax=Clostridium sp. TaxID=1506 RepID=UPI001B43503A|nr:hypothetical protein [Clostridium sp.]MBP3916225.1 hypothetical protein [Clostridium sp.]